MWQYTIFSGHKTGVIVDRGWAQLEFWYFFPMMPSLQHQYQNNKSPKSSPSYSLVHCKAAFSSCKNLPGAGQTGVFRSERGRFRTQQSGSNYKAMGTFPMISIARLCNCIQLKQ